MVIFQIREILNFLALMSLFFTIPELVWIQYAYTVAPLRKINESGRFVRLTKTFGLALGLFISVTQNGNWSWCRKF